MDYRTLGTPDLNVSAVCLGTMTFGDQNTEAEAHAQLNYALTQGINFIDTAEMYPVPPQADTYTRTETIVGNWLKHQQRDKIILGSKAAGPRRNLEWIRGGPTNLDETNLRAAVEGSLKRLQTDYIDLYQIHWPERNVPMFGHYWFNPREEFEKTGQRKQWISIQNQLETLQKLVSEGKIRYVGIANEQPWGVMEFLRVSKEFNLPRIASLQNSYNLLNRTMEFGMTEILFRESLSLLAYSPLAFGHLTGKYRTVAGTQGRVTLFPGYAQRYQKPNVSTAVDQYIKVAQKHGMTLTQMALSFVYHRWFVASTIIGATSMSQLMENIKAWNTKLTPEIIQDIEHVHLRYMNPAP